MEAPKLKGADIQRNAECGPTNEISLPGNLDEKNTANNNERQYEVCEHDELRLNFIAAKLADTAHLIYGATVAFGVGDGDLMHECLRQFALDAKQLIVASNEHRRQMRARREGGAL